MKKKCLFSVVLACCLALNSIPAHAATTAEASEEYNSPFTEQTYRVPSGHHRYNGISLSAWNYINAENTLPNIIDWNKVKASGVDFAFIEAAKWDTSSSMHIIRPDISFDLSMQGAAAVGIPVGVSIVSQAITPEEATAEAEYAVNAAKRYDTILPITMTINPSAESRLALAFENGTLTSETESANITAFCETVRNAGYQPMISAPSKLFETYFQMDKIPSNTSVSLLQNDSVPSFQGSFDYWMYTDSGKIDGIASNVSCLFYFTDEYLPGTEPADDPDTPTVNPEPPQQTADQIFRDVKASDYFCSAVTYAYWHKIMSGTSADTFDPAGTTSRAMTAKILYNLEGEPETEYSPYYSDVPDNQWYSKAITWAKNAGVMAGYGKTFGPNEPVTREQLASVLYRYSMYKRLDITFDPSFSLAQYTDASQISTYAYPAVQWAVQNDLIRGYSATVLGPKDRTKRCDCAIIFQKYHSGIAASLFTDK